jgi:hypothetical protein
MAVPFVTLIKGHGITSKESSHHSSDGSSTTSEQEVYMVRNQNPCITNIIQLAQYGTEPMQKIISVNIIPKDTPSLYPSQHNVMEGTRDVNS